MSNPDRRSAVLDTVRDVLVSPEYVGENRCAPCTVVNAAVVALAVGLLAPLWASLAALVAVGGALAIGLRGYVVPYTPAFAPRLVAALPVDAAALGFEHEGADPDAAAVARESDSLTAGDGDGGAGASDAAASDPEAVSGALVEAGVLAVDGPDLSPSDAFYDAWEAEMADLRDASDDELAAAVADAAAFDAPARVEDGGVLLDGGTSERFAWLSRPVAIAETAAVRALAEYDLPDGIRTAAARPLRLFTPVCPVCAGRLAETVAADCCGGTSGIYDTPGQELLACEACDAVVYEF
ncbi:hypothetical protein ACFO0N_15435 [Halobium salinum]|uniref:Uncharacterized protein n=1 Tax=Halobium salinum TaxID=1364940 RepID=A0ABD5PFA7_9EURY|nr:hypothetical protein [Halobium salinum]